MNNETVPAIVPFINMFKNFNLESTGSILNKFCLSKKSNIVNVITFCGTAPKIGAKIPF